MIAFAISQAATVGAFLWVLLRTQAANAAERADLLQRIQAPVLAVAQHAERSEPEPVDEDGETVDDPAFTNIP